MVSPSVLHLGSRDHERWSIQREVLAVTDHEVSQREAIAMGLEDRDVFCWSSGYWRGLPVSCRRGSRTVCFFHHNDQIVLRDPDIIAGVCMNRTMQKELRAACPGKPVYLAKVGGAEVAIEHARRDDNIDKIRLLVTGMAGAPLVNDVENYDPGNGYPLRKSPELLLPIAERLDPDRYAWVFVGSDWQDYVTTLSGRGWSVIYPGLQESPQHYGYFGEGDLFLMLSRLEGGPLPLLETMGLGIWPICTPTGIAPEIIQHGQNGHLVSMYDGTNIDEVADEVAETIQALDTQKLLDARGRVRASVADRTWANFKIDIESILRTVFA